MTVLSFVGPGLSSSRHGALSFVAACALGACGSSSTAKATVGVGGDSGTDAADANGAIADAGDADSLSSTYPAFPADYPQIVKNQGTVLEAPVVVTVTWLSDTNVATWEGFGDGIGVSSYWTATTAEYGIGPATSGSTNHVHMMRPLPASLSYTDLQNFVIAEVQVAEQPDAGVVDAGGVDAGPVDPTWPAPVVDAKGNAQTVYSLFIPASTTVTDPGSGMSFCVEGGLGYHDDVVVNGNPVAYAVSLECASQTMDDIEETAAHETVEAATNPYPESSSLGYMGFDPDHLAWDLYTGFNDELADACQNWQDSYVQETGAFPYWVQRSWSNKAALLGHDPCAPAPTGAYHGMTLLPAEESTVSLSLAAIGGGAATSRGFNVTVGHPLTFHVGFFSDAATGPWAIAVDFPATLQVFDTSFNPLTNGKATVTIDKTSGQNGEQATVTVTPTAKGKGGFQVMAITWDAPSATSGYLPHYLPILLVDH